MMIDQIASGFHIVSGISALVFGLLVFLTRKGTRLHRQLGYAYFFNMLGLNISALLIYRLTGDFGPFHGMALASLLTLIAGFVPAYLHLPRGRWLEFHYQFMNWSYVGLVAAGVSEVGVRVPSAPFWPAVAASTLIIFAVGGILIARGRSRYNFEKMGKTTQSNEPTDVFAAIRQHHHTACR
jgi:uncharacterized membrane protein